MSVLLIDNNDSFTYNIVEAIRSVCSDKWQIVRSEALDIGMLDRFSHIVISPGPMTPSDFPILSDVICRCCDHNKPLLGVCLGHQAIGEYFGARLVQMPSVVHGQRRRIKIDSTSLIYKGLSDVIEVGLYHSWAIDYTSLPDTLQATGETAEQCLMSLQHKDKHIYGIQFHPESFMTPDGSRILSNFINI